MWNRNNPYDYEDPSGYDPNSCPAGKGRLGGACVPVAQLPGITVHAHSAPSAFEAAQELERFNAPGSPPVYHAPNLIATAVAMTPADPIELHHWLPQQFRGFFKAAGINIEDYTTKLRRSEHRGRGTSVHSAGWNQQWADTFGDQERMRHLGK